MASATPKKDSEPARSTAVFVLLEIVALAVLWVLFSGKFDALHLAYGVLSIGLVVGLTRHLIHAHFHEDENAFLGRMRVGREGVDAGAEAGEVDLAGATGCEGAAAVLAEEGVHDRERDRRGARHPARDRHLAPHVALLRADVPALQADQPLRRDDPEPEEEGELRVFQVLLDALRRLHVGVLQHVRGAGTRLHARMHAQVHHPQEPPAMALEQLAEHGVAVGPGSLQGLKLPIRLLVLAHAARIRHGRTPPDTGPSIGTGAPLSLRSEMKQGRPA